MRNPALLIVLFVAPCYCQQATVNVNADSGLPHDSRPFGKYLVEICTLSAADRTVRCPLPLEKPAQKADQTITLKLVCDPVAKGKCNPQYPLVAGTDFFVSATADSGQSVRQEVVSGGAPPGGGTGTVHYRADGPGLIVIRATADETSRFTSAAPVDLLLEVVADASKLASPCAVLPPALPTQSTFLDAGAIVSLLGNPTPFVLAAQGPNTIVIYSTRQPLRGEERTILASFQGAIDALAWRTAASLSVTPAKRFTVDLKIPHASALGDLAARINGLNYSQFTVQDVGADKVRITAPAQPDCDTWNGFLSDARRMAWQLISEPMSTKLFYLSSDDVAKAFASPTPAPAATPVAATPPAPTTSTNLVPAASSNTAITVTQPPGSSFQISSDTTPCVAAGLALGNATACGSAPAAASSSSAAPSTPPVVPVPQAPLAMASMAVAAGNGTQTPPDLLVFSDANPGDDAQIQERLRVIAQLDLPRPEMIINAWVMQNSSASPRAMGAFNNMVKTLVAEFDTEFDKVVSRAWKSVRTQSADSDFFNESFRSYIEDRFVADTYQDSKTGGSVQELSQAFLDHSQAKLADPVAPGRRTDLGICERGRYCLGYTGLFKPVKPALTDLLLTIIAARDPYAVVNNTIADIERSPTPPGELPCDVAAQGPEAQSRCRAIWRNLDLNHVTARPEHPNCSDRDYRGILHSLFAINAHAINAHEPTVHLQCFKDAADRLLSPGPGASGMQAYGAGLLRAAIADFLFNYKMSQQYPHEFSPYDLSHSAYALNAALSPLIDAFNRDLWTFQMFVRADMQYRVERLNSQTDERCCVKRLFGLDKPSFFNDGLITVRTISGQSTYVNTQSQSFLNASSAPQLSTLLNSLAGTNGNASGTGSALSAVLAGNPLKRTEALASALANYQTTYAQIGRSLQFSAIPRSLASASSAEIAVTLNADESTGGPTYTGGGASDPASNTSRVANHDTATRVRVDSVKLFEISSFTAIVERSRSRFPLLPPFVSIPYIGTFAGIPLGPAKEFHSSTAVLSAYVVPTATDIAYGLRFAPDLVVDGLNPGTCSFYRGAAGPDVTNACLFRKALSLRDLSNQPVGNFNKEMIRCLTTDTSPTGCRRTSFDTTPAMY